mmetsp:Transcript_45029/g.71968  ORF Transcript_45029/g.71968 Transcript_45029/m.71968 type:complete len:461 (+) Transcript_45029:35-1417(+)
MFSEAVLYMILAIGLTVLGSIGNAAGYVLQKKGHLHHMDANEIHEIQDEKKETLLRDKIWLFGFIICLLGSLLTAAAFKFGAQSVLAPLSALVLVFNALFATKVLHEPFTRNHFFGIVLVIIGSVLAVVFGPKSNTTPTSLAYIESCWRSHVFLIFFTALTIACILDFVAVKMVEKANKNSIEMTHTIVHGANFAMVSYIAMAAYFGSVNVLFMKSLMIIIGSFEVSYFANYLFYVTIIGIIAVNVFLEYFRQRAIKFFDASYVVPIFQVLLILGAACMGAIFFGEFASLSQLEIILFVSAIFITVLGVAVLAFHIGSAYKKLMKKLDDKLHLHLSHNQPDSLRTKARKSFSKRRHGQKQLTAMTIPLPVFIGAGAAMGRYVRSQTTRRDVLPEIGERPTAEELEAMPTESAIDVEKNADGGIQEDDGQQEDHEDSGEEVEVQPLSPQSDGRVNTMEFED